MLISSGPQGLTYALAGEIDIAVAARIGADALAATVGEPGSTMAFDCAEMTFIDASGITMLLDVARRSGKRVHVVNLLPSCRVVFELLGLCQRFAVEGCGSFGARPRL